jgi:hypothetical protein
VPGPARGAPSGRRRSRSGPRRDGASQHGQEGDQGRAENQRPTVHSETRVGLGDPGQADRGERREQDRHRDDHAGRRHANDPGPRHPQRKQLGAGKAERPQGREVGRLQVGLPGQRLPKDGKRRQPGEDAKRPQRLGLQPDRSLDPGGLYLLHFGDVDAAQARGAHLAQEGLAARGAVAQPDQQRCIARRWPDAVRLDERGRHVDAAKGRRCPDGRELPRRGHDPDDADSSQPGGSGVRVAHDELDDAAHPQAFTVGGGEIDNRLTGCAHVHHPAGDDLEPVQPETRPSPQVGDGHQLRRRRHPAGGQNGRRCRHIDACPLPDLGQRLHPGQPPRRVDVPRGPAGDQVVAVLRLDEPGVGRLSPPCPSGGCRPRQADQQRQAQPCPPPGPQLRAEPHPHRAHSVPASGRHPAAHCPRTAPRPGSKPAPPSPVVLTPPGHPPGRGRLILRRARQLAGHPLAGRGRPARKR